MTDSEDLLLEIANSMSKDFVDPGEHANWCMDVAKKYFSDRLILVQTLEFYANNYVDGGSRARMALEKFKLSLLQQIGRNHV